MRADGGKGRGIGFVVAVVALLLGILIPLAVAKAGAVLVMLIVTAPLYLLLAVMPTACLIGLGAVIPGKLIGRGPFFYIAGAALAVAALMVVPYQANPVAERKARDLVAGDKLALPAPVRTATLTLVHPVQRGYRPDTNLCSDLCRTLLLDGRVQTVIVVTDDQFGAGFKPGLMGTAYTLEAAADCPEPGYFVSELQGETTSPAVGQSSRERLDLAMAQGRCLTARPARAGEADIAAVYGDMAVRGRNSQWFSDDQFTVRRMSLWRRNGAGFEETYRHTYVTYDLYFPILAPTILIEGTSSYAGFARTRHYARIEERWADSPPVADILLGKAAPETHSNIITGRTAPQQDLIRQARATLTRALDSAEAPSPAVLAVSDSYFDGLSFGRRDLDDEDLALATRLLADRRFPVASMATGLFAGKQKPSPAQAAAIADAMFGRLRDMETAVQPFALTGAQFDQARAIGDVIARLPDGDIAQHRGDMIWLMHQRTLRAPAYTALARLDRLGNGSDFLYLVDDSGMFPYARRNSRIDDRYAQHPYLAGIQGLCTLGAAAASYRLALIARIENGTVSRDGYGDIVFNALVAMGTPYEEMERLFKGSSDYVRVEYTGGGLAGPRRKIVHDLPIAPDYRRAQKRKDCSY